jgi:hypothetical protein
LIAICLSGGDDRDPSKTAVKASSAAILARILVMNTNYLAQLMSDPSTSLLLQKAGVPMKENILLCLVDVWLDKVSRACISMIRMLAVIVEVSFCTSLVCVCFEKPRLHCFIYLECIPLFFFQKKKKLCLSLTSLVWEVREFILEYVL